MSDADLLTIYANEQRKHNMIIVCSCVHMQTQMHMHESTIVHRSGTVIRLVPLSTIDVALWYT